MTTVVTNTAETATTLTASTNNPATTAITKKTVKRSTRNTNTVKPDTVAETTVSCQSNSYSVYNRNKSKEKIMCNILLEKTKREKMLLQEKEDYELAKMLQEYDSDVVQPPSNVANGENTSATASTAETINLTSINLNRTRRYFLRSRSKQNSNSSSTSASSSTVTIAAAAAAPPPGSPTISNGVTLINGKANSSKVILNGKVNKIVRRNVGRRKKLQ